MLTYSLFFLLLTEVLIDSSLVSRRVPTAVTAVSRFSSQFLLALVNISLIYSLESLLSPLLISFDVWGKRSSSIIPSSPATNGYITVPLS